MKTAFFPRLAWSGIKKNSKLYLPYILSCIGMVMMSYIMQSLSYSPLIQNMRGGGTLGGVLSLGKFVIAAFALLFLFYTNSFLIKRRYKEFGLYNILGMGKFGICRITVWESIIVAVIGLAGGIGLGILFSKLAELGLLNTIKTEIDYRFTVSAEAIIFTLEIFGAIFLLLLIKSVIDVLRLKPLELMQSEKTGEKPPKANWVFALIGLAVLGVAYYLAVSIESPISALFVFFIAVLMVILATYLLFISGSVVLCKILRKKKKYYYNKKHFVSVSSMSFRMKRNGAGLASICILSTMVLVTVSMTTSLYFGINDMIESRAERENEISLSLNDISNLTDDKIGEIRSAYESSFEKSGFTPKNVREYRYGSIICSLTGTDADLNASVEQFSLSYDNYRALYFMTADDYNRVLGTNLSLGKGESYIYTLRCDYGYDKISIQDIEMKICGKVNDFPGIGEASSYAIPSIMFVISDYDELMPLNELTDDYGEKLLAVRYYYGYNADVDSEESIKVYRDQRDAIFDISFIKDFDGISYSSFCLAEQKADFYSTFGGMFFIGIMLSMVFIFAAVMIIYYKQISEGFEDQSRFSIMKKVGMTDEDIKKSINSQILTVFFAPLILAGVHLGFAFPLIWKILELLNLYNIVNALCVTAAGFICFCLFYALIYKITARSYYSIVSSNSAD